MSVPTLPSFVELMATLGFEPTQPQTSTVPSPHLLLNAPVFSGPTRSKSTPSLREQALPRNKGVRYSPYASTFSSRRGSVSSSASVSPNLQERSPRTSSLSPHSSPRLRQRVDNKLTINIFGSSTDLSATTPISSFVRRKTPNVSPTSPLFVAETVARGTETYPMPFTLPTLPPYMPLSADSDRFPLTPEDSDIETSSDYLSVQMRIPTSVQARGCRLSRRTGVRISSAPTVSGDTIHGKYSNRSVVHVI